MIRGDSMSVPPSRPLRILLTDGNSRAALAVTRALGCRGHVVLVGDSRASALAQASRFCSGRVRYPDPLEQEHRFVAFMAAAVREHALDVLLPIADVATIVLAENRHVIEPESLLPVPEACLIRRAADKSGMVKLARRIGVPVPRTVVLERREQLSDVLPGLPFPVVVKPHRSRVRAGGHWLAASVRYAADRCELAAEIDSRNPAEFPLLLQEKVTGYGMGVFACCDNGRPVALFSHRRLREKPPSGGVSVLCESIALSQPSLRYTEALLRELRWNGVAMVEYKVDARDGQPRLMEINGRFWGSLQLAIDAGVDFPNILLSMARGEPLTATPSYRVGLRSRWFWGDVDALMLNLQTSRSRVGGRGRGAAILDFARLWQRNTYYENPRWSDFKPWLYETRQWFASALSW